MVSQDQYSAPASADVSKKPAKMWPWLLAIVLLVLVIFLWLRDGGEEEKPEGRPGADGRPVPAAVTRVEQRDIDIYLDALGTVTPRNSVVVKSRVDGELMRLHFTEGEMVETGDLLAEIDPRPFQAQLAQANGQLARDQALLDNALIDLERYQTLLEQDSISRQQTDTQAALVRQYRAAIEVDRALVDTAKLQLTYSRITAPISGRVGLRQVDAGNMISSADANGIVTIAQLQPISVLFNIPEDNLPAVLARMKKEKAVPVDAYDRSQTTKLASGTLLTLDNQIDPTTGTIKLRALFKNSEGTLFPNQFVNIRMLVNVKQDAIVIPVSALQRGRNGNYVYVVNVDQTVSLRPVQPGEASGEVMAVKEGLQAGEIVVTAGADKLRDGAAIKPSMGAAADEADADAAGKPQPPAKALATDKPVATPSPRP